jgi:hypothetical protein
MFIKEVPLRTSGGLAQAAEEAVGVLDAAEIPAPAEQKVPSWAAEGTEQQLAAVATVVGEETAPVTASESASASGPVSGGIPVLGYVRGAESAPVPQAAVTLISLGGRQLGRSVTQADGSYALAAPSVGSYVLIASADGFQPQASTVVVNGPEPAVVRRAVERYQRPERARPGGGDGQPVKDAMVIVTDVRGDLLSTGTTGEQGEFSFAELVPGAVTVAVNAAGYRPRALPVEVGGTGVTRVEIDLDSGAQVLGVVRAPHGPLADARVTLVDAAGNVVGTATTGSDGAYAFTDLTRRRVHGDRDGLPAGRDRLTVNGRGADGHDIELAHPGD